MKFYKNLSKEHFNWLLRILKRANEEDVLNFIKIYENTLKEAELPFDYETLSHDDIWIIINLIKVYDKKTVKRVTKYTIKQIKERKY